MSDNTETAVLSVSECAKVLKISRGSAYQGVMENTIPHIRIGRRILIPKRALEKLLEGSGTISSSSS
ncbi:helix-turn-helix domain-containing protein [Chloroflexota bacterium]